MTRGMQWARAVLANTLLALGLVLLAFGVTASGVLVGQPGWFIAGMVAVVLLVVLGEGAYRVWDDADNRAMEGARQLEVEHPHEAVAPGLEGWLQRRLDEATTIKRERAVRGDAWFLQAMNAWHIVNVNEMALGDQPLAPDLLDSYLRNTETGQLDGIRPPHDMAEHERYFEQRITWFRQTLDRLRVGNQP